MLEELMNLAAEGSREWVDTSDGTKYWKPYVELMVKAGVAELNGEDDNLVRLIDMSV